MEQLEYHKGEWCPYAEKTGRDPVFCQEGFCCHCQIWYEFSGMKETEEAKGEAGRVPQTDDCPKINIFDTEMQVTSRRDEMVKLREAGLSYTEIGRRLGITRERARQIFKGNPRPQKPDLQSKVMLTTSEAAHLVGVRPNTVRRWSNEGLVKSYRIGPRGDRRFRRQDLDSFLKEVEIE